MPTRNDVLKDRLSRSRQVNITVTGRKSGRAISSPVWFVLEDDKLYLLPVQGSDTQWYKNVLKRNSRRDFFECICTSGALWLASAGVSLSRG